VTFAIKILIVALDKSHVTLDTNKKEFWMKEKVNEIIHPLTSHILGYNLFGEQWEQVMCCHMSQFLIIKNIFIIILK
jgi:hypothetical protein